MPVRTHLSVPATPAERGEEFGATNSDAIALTLERYRELFTHLTGEPVDLRAAGTQALEAIFFLDGQRGWAAGWAGTILKTAVMSEPPGV